MVSWQASSLSICRIEQLCKCNIIVYHRFVQFAQTFYSKFVRIGMVVHLCIQRLHMNWLLAGEMVLFCTDILFILFCFQAGFAQSGKEFVLTKLYGNVLISAIMS